MKIAITGITGNMGQATLEKIINLDFIDELKLLILPKDKQERKLLKKYKKMKNKISVIHGNLKDLETCKKLVEDTQYVINLAAVIPPHSDQNPQNAIDCNETGVKNLVKAIEQIHDNQPKLIHISTVALYGNRNYKHPWGQVGDPLLVSPYDIYSATKLRGEFAVLESNIKNFVVLRQTAMLHYNLLSGNVSDGLMFHTCFNAPLEWVTAEDSGTLIANILIKDQQEDLTKVFWNRCFNIGGGNINCVTGYNTLNDGFVLIGGSAKDFFDPNYNSTRNFHGMWFYDSNKLEDLFHFQSQSVQDFWKIMEKKYSYYKAGAILPKKLIRKLVIERLLSDPNSPTKWVKDNDEGKIIAYFKSKDNYDNIAKKWKNFNLLVENKDENGNFIDYNKLKDIKNADVINYFFDINKDDNEISLSDLQNVAKAHGGKLLSTNFEKGNLHKPLEWETFDKISFKASPYTVLKAGHWVNKTYFENTWEFDTIAKEDKIASQIWYDSHDENENYIYSLDDNFHSKITKKD